MSVAILSERAIPRALITGHRGFTGRYVINQLVQAGYAVDGLEAVDGTPIDLSDRAAVRAAVERVQPDVVVHLAAIAFVAHGDADVIYRTNIVGTRNLLEALAALQRSPRAVLLASSANIYGNSATEYLDENVSPCPANDYAVSKLAMEQMAKLWRDRLPLIIARPFNYTGIGQSGQFLLPKIVNHFRHREMRIELGNLNVARDFNDVRFIADAYCRLLRSPQAIDQIVNLCSGQVWTLTEIIHLMEAIAGYRIEVLVNPAFVRQNEVATLAGSNAKLIDLIGPLHAISLPATLQWMYEAEESS